MKPQMQAWILERRQQILAAPGVSEAELEDLVRDGHFGDVVIVADELVIVPAEVSFAPANVIYSNGLKPSEVKRTLHKEPDRDKAIAKRAKRKVERAPKPAAKKPQAFAFPECGQKFERAQGLGVHRARKHGVPGKASDASHDDRIDTKAALICPECGAQYSVRGFFENHMAKAHPKGEQRDRALREAGLV